MDAFLLDELAESQGIDHRCKHTHPVSAYTVEAFVKALEAPEYVAATVYYPDLETCPGRLGDFPGIFPKVFRIQSLAFRAAKAFTAKFLQNSLVHTCKNKYFSRNAKNGV